MPKASVLQLVADLARGRADAATVALYYDDVVFELAVANQTIEFVILPTIPDGEMYRQPDDSIDIIAVMYDDMQLQAISTREAESHNNRWRDERGTPLDYVVQSEFHDTLRLYPLPEVASKDFLWFTSDPLGADYPEYSLVMVYKQKQDDLPAYFDLYIATEILAREFARESDHRDLKYAKACEQFAQLLLRMVV